MPRGRKSTTSNEERLLSSVLCDVETQCWNWQKFLHGGYGQMYISGKTERAHRVSYRLFIGSIPDGHQVHHTCQNPRCCNPEHLKPVTAPEHKQEHEPRPPKMRCKRGHPLWGKNMTIIKTKTGHQRLCLTCQAERFAKHRNKDIEAYRAYQRAYQQARRERLKNAQQSPVGLPCPDGSS